MEVIEGNKLIAEFMDYTHNFWYINNQLDYHDNWGRLMPVVIKIQSIAPTRFVIDNNECKIIGDTKIKVFNSSKIISVWETCIKFIQWYNSQHPIT